MVYSQANHLWGFSFLCRIFFKCKELYTEPVITVDLKLEKSLHNKKVLGNQLMCSRGT